MAKQTFTLPDELDKEFRDYCKKNDVNFSQIIRKGIRKIIKKESGINETRRN